MQVCCLTPQAIEHFMVIISDLKIQALRKFNFTASEASLFYHVRQLSCIAFLIKSKLSQYNAALYNFNAYSCQNFP